MIPLKLLVVSLVGFGGNLDGVVLDFTAPWCGPCQQVSPIVSKLERNGYPIRKVDLDSNRDLARKFNVQAIPAFVLVINGVEQDRIVGAASEDQLIRLCARIPRQSETRQSTPERAPAPEAPRKTLPSAETRPAGTEILLAGNEAGSPKSGFKLPSLFGGGGKKKEEPRVVVTPDGTLARANYDDRPSSSRPPVEGNPQAASVRIRVNDSKGEDVGSGTIIDSRIGATTILTCGHIFRNWDKQARIEIDFFRDGRMETAVGRRLYHNLEDDVGLIVLTNVEPLASCRVAPVGMKIVKGAPVVSVGCSLGGDPSVQMLKITALNRYLGADNIEVGGMPAQGRSGGGLFAKDGQLIGVCSGADAHHREGLYVGLDTIQKLLDHCNLAHLYRPIGRGDPGQRLPGKQPVSTEPIDPADAEPGTAVEFASADGRKKAGTPATNALPRKRQPASPSEEGADVGGDEGAIREALEQAGEAEIVCIIRPIHQPRAASRVVILNRASRRFVAYLSDEIDSQPEIQETTLKAKEPLPRQLAERQQVKRPAASPVADAPRRTTAKTEAKSDDAPPWPTGPQPYVRKRPARSLARVTGP